jgi:transcriptional regulator with GAF, ATPase, and Fis domain
VLDREKWNQSAAARRLGTTESGIRQRMKQYGIRKPAAPGKESP